MTTHDTDTDAYANIGPQLTPLAEEFFLSAHFYAVEASAESIRPDTSWRYGPLVQKGGADFGCQ